MCQGAIGRQWYHCPTMRAANDHLTGASGANEGATPTSQEADAARVAGAGGVVFDAHGNVLLLLHANGDWIFPKGHLEGIESPLEAALREVTEETGVSAWCPEPDRSWITTYTNSRGVPRQITWFACFTDDAKTSVTEKSFVEASFLPPDAALRQLTFDADRRLLTEIVAASAHVARGKA